MTQQYLHEHSRKLMAELEKDRVNVNRCDSIFWDIDRAFNGLEMEKSIDCYSWQRIPDVNVELRHFSLVAPILKNFAKLGWHQQDSMETNAWGWKWKLKKDDKHITLHGSPIYAGEEVQSDGKTCKRVLVGTEMVERPIYKIICDGEEVEDNA